MAKYMIKLRISRGGGYPGLFVGSKNNYMCDYKKSTVGNKTNT